MLTRFVTILCVTLALAACATAPAPNEAVAGSLAALRGAEEIGAAEVPQAALLLQLAQEEVTRAKELMDDGDNAEARTMALRARSDAELALALTREDQIRRDSEAAKRSLAAAKNQEDRR